MKYIHSVMYINGKNLGHFSFMQIISILWSPQKRLSYQNLFSKLGKNKKNKKMFFLFFILDTYLKELKGKFKKKMLIAQCHYPCLFIIESYKDKKNIISKDKKHNIKRSIINSNVN